MLTSPAWFSSWLSSSASTRAISVRSGATVGSRPGGTMAAAIRRSNAAGRSGGDVGRRRRSRFDAGHRPTAAITASVGRRLDVSVLRFRFRLGGRNDRVALVIGGGRWRRRFGSPMGSSARPMSARTCDSSASRGRNGLAVRQQVAHAAPSSSSDTLQRVARLGAGRHVLPSSMPMISDSSSCARSPMAVDTRHAGATLQRVQRALERRELIAARRVQTDALERGLRFLQQLGGFVAEDRGDLRIVVRRCGRLGIHVLRGCRCRLDAVELSARNLFLRDLLRAARLVGRDATLEIAPPPADALVQRWMRMEITRGLVEIAADASPLRSCSSPSNAIIGGGEPTPLSKDLRNQWFSGSARRMP